MNELRNEMMQIATGYWLSKALFCAARTDVADQLAGRPSRREVQYRDLLREAGLVLQAILATAGPVDVIEARA